MSEVRQPEPGEGVIFTDEKGVKHNALLTAVHGAASEGYQPSVNLLYVTADTAKTDPYGLQIERSSSVVNACSQGAHGMFWDFG